MNSRHMLCCLFVSLAIVGCGDMNELTVEDEQSADAGQELLNGQRSQARSEIGQMTMTHSDGLQYNCTATLVEPSVLITARHCVNWTTCESDACATRHNGSVTFTNAAGRSATHRMTRFVSFDRNGQVAENGGRRQIDVISTNRNDYWLSSDVAVVLLDRPVAAAIATPTTLLNRHPQTGDDMSIWGFGCQNRTTQNGGNFKQFIDFVQGSLSNSLCPGDSGGPVTQGRNGGVVYVNSGYQPDRIDIFGDVIRFRGQITNVINGWLADQTPNNPPQTGGCFYTCEGPNTRTKTCNGSVVERKTVCGSTQECTSLSPTQTTCQNKGAAEPQPQDPQPNQCVYACEGPNTRIKTCDGSVVERKAVCGSTQECVSLSPTQTTCQNKEDAVTPDPTPECFYQCTNAHTRVQYCRGQVVGQTQICGSSQECVNVTNTSVVCQNL